MNDAEAETLPSLALFDIYGCNSESSYPNHNAQNNKVHRKVVCSFIEVFAPVWAYSCLSHAYFQSREVSWEIFAAQSPYLFEKETEVPGHSDKTELSFLFLASLL